MIKICLDCVFCRPGPYQCINIILWVVGAVYLTFMYSHCITGSIDYYLITIVSCVFLIIFVFLCWQLRGCVKDDIEKYKMDIEKYRIDGEIKKHEMSVDGDIKIKQYGFDLHRKQINDLAIAGHASTALKMHENLVRHQFGLKESSH